MEQALIILACFGLMGGSWGVLVFANRHMMKMYRAYADQFGLEVASTRSFGLEKWPRVHGTTSEGRELEVKTGPRRDKRYKQGVDSIVTISGNPKIRFRIDRKPGVRAPSGDDMEAIEKVFDIETGREVLEELRAETRQKLVTWVDGRIFASETMIVFATEQRMMTSEKERKRFTAVTEVLLEILEIIERE